MELIFEFGCTVKSVQVMVLVDETDTKVFRLGTNKVRKILEGADPCVRRLKQGPR